MADINLTANLDTSNFDKGTMKIEGSAVKMARAIDRANREFKFLDQQFAKGNITQKRYNQAITEVSSSLDRYEKRLEQAAAAQRQYAASTNASNRGISRYQVLTQQTGYQVGDFIVQIQSGTNAMVAFGQQATQVAGTLTLLGNKWVYIGSVLGIAIPLATALGAAWMRTRKESKQAAESILSDLNSLEGSYKEVNSLADTYNSLVEAASVFGGRYLENANLLKEEIQVRRELLSIEKTRFEIKRLQMEQEVSSRQRVIDGLFEELQVSKEIALQSATTEAERFQITQNYLEKTQEIVKANKELFLSQREQRSELRLIDVVLEKIKRNFDESEKSAANLNSYGFDNIRQASNYAGTLSRNMQGAAAAWAAFNASGTVPNEGGITKEYTRPDLTFGGNLNTSSKTGTLFSPTLPMSNMGNREFLEAWGVGVGSGKGSSGGGSGGGGGGKSIADQTQEYIENLQKELDNKKKLVGVYGEEKDIREQTIKLLEQVEEKGLNISEKQLERHVRQMNQLEERIKFEENLYDTLHGGIEDGLMALIDGTKSFGDVARNTMRQIILDVYKQAFVKPVASSIAGSIFGAIFDGGGYTGSGPRSGGVDGKGGFPAILHPNETVVDHTKGQSMGSINITQNFNFTANGDETIKRIISQEAPKIADYTKKSVLEARSRGGPWKQRFGG